MQNLIVIGRAAVELCFICRKVSFAECLIGILLDADGNGSHLVLTVLRICMTFAPIPTHVDAMDINIKKNSVIKTVNKWMSPR